jgi:hypothetical protein
MNDITITLHPNDESLNTPEGIQWLDAVARRLEQEVRKIDLDELTIFGSVVL